jgi:hypothetical protein
VPQYLVSERPLVLFIGLVFQATGPKFKSRKGKSFNGGSFNGNEEEGKKEKALTAGETQSRIVRIFTGLSGEAPPERLFLFSGWSSKTG